MNTKKVIGFASIGIIGIIAGLVISARTNIMSNLKAENKEKTTQGVPGEDIPTVNLPSFADIAEKVLPSVVNVEGEGKVRINLPVDPFFEFFFGPQPREFERSSLGSGFIFRKKDNTYYVMTNNHVIKDMDKIILKLYDGTVIEKVEVVGADQATDIAVLKFESKNDLIVAKLGDSDNLRVGDWVMAIGSPFGLSSTVTVGVISAKHRELTDIPEGPSIQDFLQTDAAINPGNSGGPLVNVEGEVIGVNTAIVSRTGQYAGIGFAVPINIAKNVANQLIEKGKIDRGYLGIYMQDVDENIAKALKLKKPYGVIISDVVKDSPAERAGLKTGDVIIEVDGRSIENSLQLRSYIQSKSPDDKVKIGVIRDGKRETFTVKLGSAEKLFSQGFEKGTMKDKIGLEVEERNGKVVVTNVEKGSLAESVGIESGDIILQINKREIRSLRDYREAMEDARKKGSVLMLLQSGKMKKWAAFSL